MIVFYRLILVFAATCLASIVTAQTFKFENCKLIDLESSFKHSKSENYYPASKTFSFGEYAINWGDKLLKLKKIQNKGIYTTYFNMHHLQRPSTYGDQSKLNLHVRPDGTGKVQIFMNSRDQDKHVKFICSAGKRIKSQNKQTIVGQDTNRQPQLKISEETKPKRSALKLAFTNLSENQRKEVQFNLKNLNFYNSSIDGLYGSKTAQALEAYNSEHLGGSDLDKTGSVKRLLFSLVNATPPSETFSPME